MKQHLKKMESLQWLILVKNGDCWDIYEVKASTNVKEYHLNDASVQWY